MYFQTFKLQFSEMQIFSDSTFYLQPVSTNQQNILKGNWGINYLCCIIVNYGQEESRISRELSTYSHIIISRKNDKTNTWFEIIIRSSTLLLPQPSLSVELLPLRHLLTQ
jgi:hypothetical protein